MPGCEEVVKLKEEQFINEKNERPPSFQHHATLQKTEKYYVNIQGNKTLSRAQYTQEDNSLHQRSAFINLIKINVNQNHTCIHIKL